MLKSLALRVTGHCALGNHKAALHFTSRLARLEPSLGWARFYRAGLWLKFDRPRKVLEDLRALEAVAPDMMFAAGREMELPAAAADPRTDGRMASLLAAEPRLPWLHVLDSFRHRLRARWEASGRAMDRAISLDPENPTILGLAARVSYVSRLPASSVAAMEKAWRLAPGCFWICAWMGEVKRYTGDLPGALELLTAAIERNPRFYIAYSWRGSVRRLLGSPALALKDLDLAIRWEWAGEDDPASLAWAYNERALVKRDLRDHAGAFRDLARAHRLNQRYTWAQSGNRSGQPSFEESLSLLDGIVADQPRSAWALAWRGFTLGSCGRASEAAQDLDRALELDPCNAWAYAWRAEADLIVGRQDRALDWLNRSVALDPRYAMSRLLRGKFLNARGLHILADRDLERSVSADPFCAAAWAERGRAALGQGRQKQAETFLRRARELDSLSA